MIPAHPQGGLLLMDDDGQKPCDGAQPIGKSGEQEADGRNRTE
jgi:hypothetical protein